MSDLDILIDKAIKSHEQKVSTPKNKRKSEGQLSAEKDKPPKQSNLNTSSGYSSESSNMSSMEFSTGTRPKPLRTPITQLGNIDCAAAFSLRQAILRKDATHSYTASPAITIDDAITKIGDGIIDKHFLLTKCMDSHFKEFLVSSLTNDDDTNNKLIDPSSTDFISFCNSIFTLTTKIITDLKLSKEECGDHGDDAIKAIATALANNASAVITAHKDSINPFILSPNRTSNTATKDLYKLVILGANFDQMWNSLVHSSLPSSKNIISLSTLANMHTKTNKTLAEQTIQVTELDHQVTKLTVRLGDLRTSELEVKYKELENELRVHNINTLGLGTPEHFRALTYPNKVTAIHDFVKSHMDKQSVAFSTQIMQPKSGGRHFETLVILRFIHTADKFDFEKNFSIYRKSNPSCTISTSRCTPQRAPSDRDLPNINDIKAKIGMLYNSKISATKTTHPTMPFNTLTTDQINSIQLGPKTKSRPFKLYYEFLDPSNGTTFCTYDLVTDPFKDHDFTQKMANPITRKHALSDPVYNKVFEPKTFTKTN